MTSAGIIIAKRGGSTMFNRIAGRRVQLISNETIKFGCRSIHNHGQPSTQLLFTSSAASAYPNTHQPQSCGSASTTSIIGPPTTKYGSGGSIFTPLGSTIRYFGRKGSRMGHHAQNLDEMAHSESREEAKHRREEKKKKSKRSRMNSHKEGGATDDTAIDDDTFGSSNDNNESSSASDGDFGPKEDEFGNPLLPESSAVRSNMLMVVAHLERSFASIRGGEATPELFDAVRVSAYGETVPLSSVGQVVIEDPQRATISCYDPSVAADVRDAVRDMPGMNLNPYVEEGGSGVVIIPIPRASEETRREMVKELGRQAENGKQRIRNIRRKAMDIIKKGKDGKLDGISKDDAFRVGKDVDSVTEEVLSVLKDMVEKKQKSVMDD